MSARWRRSRKGSKWFSIFKAFEKVRDKSIPRALSRANSKKRRQACAKWHKAPKTRMNGRVRDPDPLVDVLEAKDEIVVVAELAGFNRENLKINVKNQRLTLSAETWDRKYYKSLNLPKRVIPRTMRTTYKNGVLEVQLKKAAEEKAIGKVAG